MMYAAQWLDSPDCLGPPSSIYITNGSNPFYDFVTQEYDIGLCGYLTWRESLRCCYSSLDLEQSHNVQSGSHYIAPIIPRTNQDYCWIVSDIFDGYQQLMMLPDKCIDGKYQCTLQPPQLLLFDDDGCNQTAETFPLDNTVYQSIYGTFTGNISRITGDNTYYWIASTPGAWLVPKLSHLTTAEAVAIPFYILALSIGLWSCYFDMRRHIKTRSAFTFARILSQMVWTGWVVAKFFYWTTEFDAVESDALFIGVTSFIFNLATMSIVMRSAIFLNELYYTSARFARLNYGVIITLHIIFAGELYFEYWSNTPNPLQQYLIYWGNLTPYWIVCLYVYNLLPCLLTSKSLLRMYWQNENAGLSSVITDVWDRDRRIIVVLVMQIVVVLAHLIMAVLKSTIIFHSDRTLLALESVTCFLLMLHCMLVVIFIERMPTVLKLASEKLRALDSVMGLSIIQTDQHKTHAVKSRVTHIQ